MDRQQDGLVELGREKDRTVSFFFFFFFFAGSFLRFFFSFSSIRFTGRFGMGCNWAGSASLTLF